MKIKSKYYALGAFILSGVFSAWFFNEPPSTQKPTPQVEYPQETLPKTLPENTSTPTVEFDIEVPIQDLVEESSRLLAERRFEIGAAKVKAHLDSIQPTKEEISNFSTYELLGELRTSTLSQMMRLELVADGGLAHYAGAHHGVQPFLDRTDASTTLLAEYKENTEKIGHRPDEALYIFHCGIMEVLLASPELQEQITSDAGKQEAISLILESVDARRKYNAAQPEPVYGERIRYSSLAISKFLDSLGGAEYKTWLAEREPGIFTTRAMTYKEAQEIISIASVMLN